jgi:hypothetical protein
MQEILTAAWLPGVEPFNFPTGSPVSSSFYLDPGSVTVPQDVFEAAGKPAGELLGVIAAAVAARYADPLFLEATPATGLGAGKAPLSTGSPKTGDFPSYAYAAEYTPSGWAATGLTTSGFPSYASTSWRLGSPGSVASVVAEVTSYGGGALPAYVATGFSLGGASGVAYGLNSTALGAGFNTAAGSLTLSWKGNAGFDISNLESKLSDYLLNPSHPQNQSKAIWFEQALGFKKSDWLQLASQITFDESKAIATTLTQYGQKFEQIITINGLNGKAIDVPFIFIKDNTGTVSFVTGIPVKK